MICMGCRVVVMIGNCKDHRSSWETTWQYWRYWGARNAAWIETASRSAEQPSSHPLKMRCSRLGSKNLILSISSLRWCILRLSSRCLWHSMQTSHQGYLGNIYIYPNLLSNWCSGTGDLEEKKEPIMGLLREIPPWLQAQQHNGQAVSNVKGQPLSVLVNDAVKLKDEKDDEVPLAPCLWADRLFMSSPFLQQLIWVCWVLLVCGPSLAAMQSCIMFCKRQKEKGYNAKSHNLMISYQQELNLSWEWLLYGCRMSTSSDSRSGQIWWLWGSKSPSTTNQVAGRRLVLLRRSLRHKLSWWSPPFPYITFWNRQQEDCDLADRNSCSPHVSIVQIGRLT